MKRLLDGHLIAGAMLAAVAATVGLLLNAETPHGQVRGTLVTAESGSALSGIRVTLARTDASAHFTARTDRNGTFAFLSVPVGYYRLTADTQAHEQPAGKIQVVEGKISSAVYELKPSEPFLRVFNNQRVYTPKETPKVRVHGFVPAGNLSVRVYRVAPEAAVRMWHRPAQDVLHFRGDDIAKANLDEFPSLRLVSSRDVPVTHRDIEGTFREEVALGAAPLPPGMYIIGFQALDTRALAMIAVTDLGVVVKSAHGDAVVYAADLETGRPVSNATIEVRDGEDVVARGATDGSGMLSLHMARAKPQRDLEVVGRHGASMAIAQIYQSGDEGTAPLRVFTYTDRPVYRPGQTVYFKSIVRSLENDRYSVPKHVSADVTVTDQNQDVIYKGTLNGNGFGSFADKLTLNRETLPGPYTVSVSINDRPYEAYFAVAEYRKPEYEVTVTPERQRYTRGETVKATVSAQYYYGAPVADAEVEYQVTRSQHWFSDAGEWDDDLSGNTGTPDGMMDESPDGEIVTSGTGTTDADGRLVLSIPPQPAPEGESEEDTGEDWSYTITATVTDAAKRGQDGSASVLVTQGDFQMDVSPDDFLARPGQAVTVRVHAVDYDGKPVAGAKGSLEFAEREWQGDKEEIKDTVSYPFTTDGQGEASVTVTPRRDGDYRLLARSADSHGNRIVSASGLWVMSNDYDTFSYPYQDLQVRAGKKLYHEGDVAQVVVNTKHAPQTALLTIEGAHIFERRLVHLTGKSTLLSVILTPDEMPAVRASLCFFRDKQFVSSETVLNVSRERKALNVEVTPDKPSYQPGEPATFHVRTLAPDGKPVPAEVSLGVVDEAVYAIAPDSTPEMVKFFYPKRLYEVQTAYSFPDIYLSGDDKAGSTIRTRRFFPDTALWEPSTVTDGDGRATFRFTMPDNLTTWRATVRAATMDTRVGQAVAKAVVRKPFLVRLEAPRFFTQGDQVEVAGVVHNLTASPVDATVALEPGSLTLLDGARQTRRVDPGKTERVAWRVRADTIGDAKVRVWAAAGSLNDAMELTLPVLPKGRAQTDVASGGIQRSATVPLIVRNDCIPGSQKLIIRLSPTLLSAMLGSLGYLADYPYGCAEQTMSSFLPDIVLYRMLKEQGLNDPGLEKRLPDMVQAGLFKLYGFQHPDGGWRWWTYDDTDPWMTAYVVYGLMQARDAGFAVNAGSLNRGIVVLSNLSASDRKMDADTRAFSAYVLFLSGHKDAAQGELSRFAGDSGALRRGHLSDWGRAMLALALAHAGQTDAARATLAPVWAHFASGHFVSQPSGTADTWRSDAEHAGALLYAACEITPNDPRLPELVRWLMLQRRGDHWDSTRDTAQVLYALSRYVALTKELHPDMEATVVVNGRTVARRRFTAADVLKPEAEITVDAASLPTGPVSIALNKTGPGMLYYTATLEQVAAMDLSVPVRNDSGITIERAYRRYVPGGKPDDSTGTQTDYNSGDVIEVTLTVRSQRALDYLMVEDPIPAGTEARDRGPVESWEWTYWWADQIVRDEKVAFAIRHLEPGVQRITYRLYAQEPGTDTALPPRIYDMYHPDVKGEGAASTVTIRP